MNLKQLQYFIAVVEEKQITAAAKKLNIAQPPLSYQLKQLEAELETRLFTRTAHGIVLTDAGMMLEKYARKILDLTTVAEEKVKKTTKGELGKISLGTVSSSAAALPIGKLKEFRKYYPEINFEIFESNTYGILEKLFNGEIDLVLV
ncbi:LysR family transcriptional regulator, partial [Lactobacillus salivarius]